MMLVETAKGELEVGRNQLCSNSPNRATRSNMKSLFQAVAAIIHSQILEAQSSKLDTPRSKAISFNHGRFKLERTEDIEQFRVDSVLERMPTVDDIYDFVKNMHDTFQMSPECFVICLIYIDRLVSISDIQLLPTNWRTITLCSLIVAQEVWNFRDLSNLDFSSVHSIFITEKVSQFYEKFLELLQHKIYIRERLYSKYYSNLRNLFKNENEFPFPPMDAVSAQEFEARSDQVRKTKLLKKAMQSIFNGDKNESEHNKSSPFVVKELDEEDADEDNCGFVEIN